MTNQQSTTLRPVYALSELRQGKQAQGKLDEQRTTTLGLATVTSGISLALMQGEKVLASLRLERQTMDDLTDLIDYMLVRNNISVEDINHLVVVNGPGTYSGIRTSLTAAKMLSFVRNIPITPVRTVELLAYQNRLFNGLIIVAMASRRDDVNFGLYGSKGQSLNSIIEFEVVNLSAIISKCQKIEGDYRIIGDIEAEKLPPELRNKFVFTSPDAVAAIRLAREKKSVPLHQIDPIYAFPVNIGGKPGRR